MVLFGILDPQLITLCKFVRTEIENELVDIFSALKHLKGYRSVILF